MEYLPPVYKPWVLHSNGSLSSLIPSGMEIGLKPGTTPSRSPLQKNNKTFSNLLTHQAATSNNLEDSGTEGPQIQLETKSSFPIRNFPLERVKDSTIPPTTQLLANKIRRNTLSTGSARKVRQLLGLDLNIGDNLPLNYEAEEDDNSLRSSGSSTGSVSSRSMYSQPGLDYGMENAGFVAQRSLAPIGSGTLLQSSTYQRPKQMQMNQQLPRSLRHTDRPNRPQKVKTMRVVRPHNVVEMNGLRDIVFQEQQRHNMVHNASYAQETRYPVANPIIAELEDTDIGLMPKPLTLRTKKRPNQSQSSFSPFQSAANSWNYGVNELASTSTVNYTVSEHSRPSSRNTRGSTPVSPMGSMESDNIVLPPIPDTPPMHGRRPDQQLGNGKYPFQRPFAFNSSNSDEESDSVPSLTRHKPTRRLSGKLMGWSGAKSHTQSKAKRADRPDAPALSKGVLTALQVPQKSNGHFHGIVEKTREKVLKKSAEERRRQSLKGKIVIVGVPDQSPDGRVSEWL